MWEVEEELGKMEKGNRLSDGEFVTVIFYA